MSSRTKRRIVTIVGILLFSVAGVCACTGAPLVVNQAQATAQSLTPGPGQSPSTGGMSETPSLGTGQPESTPLAAGDENQAGFPRIANLWGLIDADTDLSIYAGFDLVVPYTFPDPANQASALRALNPDILILHNQYATKGRSEFDPIFQQWWDSKPGDSGYLCFFRDSQGNILLVDVWNHPMVNMTNPTCREAMVQKNLDDFKASSYVNGVNTIYDGVYWDLVFGRISWLGSDIDSNGDGQPDDLDTLDQAYQQGVMDFLGQLRESQPDLILAGNEASPNYSKWMNGRLFEWQLSNLFTGIDYLTWDEVISEYRDWTTQAVTPRTTIIQDAPADPIALKYSGDQLDQIPAAMMAEAQASYQRMRYGLASALMGNGYYSFDFGPMIHGFPWWYDEYGAPVGDEGSSLPPRGYLGQPVGDPFELDGIAGVWARKFEGGLAVINPTQQAVTAALPATYCKVKGDQAPLFKVIVDDDQASFSGGWTSQTAQLDQFGLTVNVSDGSTSDMATYAPALAYPGEYEVFAWISPSSSRGFPERFTVWHAGGSSEVSIDAAGSEAGWQSLGVYNFDAGSSGSVELHSSGSGTLIADAVKWESTARYNDGAAVDQLTLQPLDGIVLVNCGQ